VTTIDDTEGLMVFIMELFAEKFGNHAILKGGMELRLLDCPRSTNDLDYVFVPYGSKNEIKKMILSALQKVPGLDVEHTVHSTCIRYIVARGTTRVQIEANAATDCKSEALSTASLANARNLQPQIIRVMSLDCALSHKLAAWNERRLIRDLYDASFMKNTLGVSPDMDTLRQRLRFIHRRNTKNFKTEMSLADFIETLETAIGLLDQKSVEAELGDFFAPGQLPGLSMKIRVGIENILSFLKQQDENAAFST
jgi:predicted nucleotidyltransferase component of viral defense system